MDSVRAFFLRLRYWDTWTGSAGLLVPGLVFSLVMPIIGFVIGIVLLTRNENLDGITVLVASCIGAGLWLALIG